MSYETNMSETERIIVRVHMIELFLHKVGNLTFSLPIIRDKVMFLGHEFIFKEATREATSKGLINEGFDNLTSAQIMHYFDKFKDRRENAKAHKDEFFSRRLGQWVPKKKFSMEQRQAMLEKWQRNLRFKVGRGEF